MSARAGLAVLASVLAFAVAPACAAGEDARPGAVPGRAANAPAGQPVLHPSSPSAATPVDPGRTGSVQTLAPPANPGATITSVPRADATPAEPLGAGERPLLPRLGIFRLGVLASGDAYQTQQRIAPFKRRLRELLGVEVQVMPFRSANSLADGVATQRVDYAIVSSTQYAFAWTLCRCVEPLAAPRNDDGSLGFHAVMFARTADPADRIEALKGKVLAVSGEQSLAGRLLPFAAFARAGLDVKAHFARIDTYADPAAALRAVAQGKADASLGWSSLVGDPATGWTRGTLAGLAAHGAVRPADIKVIWQSAQVPNGPHVVRSTLDPEIKQRLRALLVELQARDPEAYDAAARGPGGGFAPIDHAYYAPLAELYAPLAAIEAPGEAPGAPGG